MTLHRSLAFGLVLLCLARPLPAQIAPEPAATEALDAGVAATVNGHPILESEIDERFLAVVAAQTGGAMLPDEQLQTIKEGLRAELLDMLVGDHLLDEAVEAAGIEVQPEELRAEIEREVNGFLVKSGTTRAEFAERILEADEISLDEFLARRASDPEYVRSMHHARLIDARYPERTAVTQDEVEARYAQDLPEVYDRPQLVRARHILVALPEDAPEDDVQAAHEQAERLALLSREPGADFAELAREHSDDGSSRDGGDVGYFGRDDIPFEAFTEAAFALEPGSVSDPVRTPYGFHVIQSVAVKAAHVVPLTDAAQSIRLELHWEKLDAVREELLAELRATADVRIG